ncbi:hypothetical protein PISL3812_08589 [Talaromyces islandicus]|uniref:Uncharacterized protein n=1 Tax=Talaromyces islandicus TaxID=28573 RepID=A0A0U1M7I2_TALIS|nr:hypothetical protein PISL3812_08589 [Talaromyces islandicus]
MYRTHHSMMSSNPGTAMGSSPYGNQFVQSLPAAMPSSSSMSPMLDTTRSQSVSDMGHYSPPSPCSRGPIYHANGLIEDIYAAPYDSSSPAYVHPSSSSVSYSGGYHGSPPSRAWEPTASGTRHQLAVLYSEADTSAASSSTGQSLSASSDVPSLFPIVNMLTTGDGPIIGGASENLASSSSTISSSVLGSSSSGTNYSELIGSGLPFMPSEYFAYPMHTLDSSTSFRPKSSSTATVSPLTLCSDLSTSSFYVNVPYDTSSSAAGPMASVYRQSDAVEESNPSEESQVMSMSASLKESPSESGSYEYANGDQYVSNVEADDSNMLENQQYGHFKRSNNAAAVYDAFGFLQSSAAPNVSSNHEEN